MMEIKNIHNELSQAMIEYRSSVARNSGVAAAKDRLKNLLFNNREAILECLARFGSFQKETDILNDQILALEAALTESDAENNELRLRVREMEAAGNKKQKTKTMTAVVE